MPHIGSQADWAPSPIRMQIGKKEHSKTVKTTQQSLNSKTPTFDQTYLYNVGLVVIVY